MYSIDELGGLYSAPTISCFPFSSVIEVYTDSVLISTSRWSINHRLLDCTQNCGLEQMVNFPIRQRTTLDLFFTNQPSLVDKCLPAPGVADHDIGG
jgi:hypothetical protein